MSQTFAVCKSLVTCDTISVVRFTREVEIAGKIERIEAYLDASKTSAEWIEILNSFDRIEAEGRAAVAAGKSVHDMVRLCRCGGVLPESRLICEACAPGCVAGAPRTAFQMTAPKGGT